MVDDMFTDAAVATYGLTFLGGGGSWIGGFGCGGLQGGSFRVSMLPQQSTKVVTEGQVEMSIRVARAPPGPPR